MHVLVRCLYVYLPVKAYACVTNDERRCCRAQIVLTADAKQLLLLLTQLLIARLLTAGTTTIHVRLRLVPELI